MPKQTNQFQQLVYLIQLQLKDRPETVVTESKMLIDRNTGHEREADIAVECVANGIPFVVAFECRDRTRKPTIEWVEQMVKKHENLSDKLVLVANRAFSAKASDIAARYRAETVVLDEATKADWAIRIDRYRNLFLATFEFRIDSFRVEYAASPGSPQFSNEELIEIGDSAGRYSKIFDFANAIAGNHDAFGKQIMKLWYAQPVEKRRDELLITANYHPPQEQPVMLRQGNLAYLLAKLSFVVAAKFGGTQLSVQNATFRDVRVAHGEADLATGHMKGQKVRFVMTEREGELPSAAVQFSKGGEGMALTRYLDFRTDK